MLCPIPVSRHWFQEMLNMEANRTCGTNEQNCFKAFYSRNSYGTWISP